MNDQRMASGIAALEQAHHGLHMAINVVERRMLETLLDCIEAGPRPGAWSPFDRIVGSDPSLGLRIRKIQIAIEATAGASAALEKLAAAEQAKDGPDRDTTKPVPVEEEIIEALPEPQEPPR